MSFCRIWTIQSNIDVRSNYDVIFQETSKSVSGHGRTQETIFAKIIILVRHLKDKYIFTLNFPYKIVLKIFERHYQNGLSVFKIAAFQKNVHFPRFLLRPKFWTWNRLMILKLFIMVLNTTTWVWPQMA